MLLCRKFVDRLPPEQGPFDFPNFGAAIRIFDAVALPILLSEHRRVSRQIINPTAGIGFANSRNAAGAAVLRRLWRFANDFRSVQPAMEIAGYFTNEGFAELIQVVEELGVSPVEFVERPCAHADAIGQRMFDLVDGDLWFCLKLNLIRYVVFLRRASSSAQLFGRYIRLSSRL